MFVKTSAARLLCLVLASCIHSQVAQVNGASVKKCPPMEIGIVLDSSSSVDDNEFAKAKGFLQGFLGQFEIGSGPSDVRVSLITYGFGIYTKDAFNLDAYKTKAKVLRAIAKVPHHEGNRTDTGLAIEYMHTKQLNNAATRRDAIRVGIVITDGQSQDWQFTQRAAADARADGISMFAIGVGSSAGDKELLRIAGNQKRKIRVDNYDKLVDITGDLRKRACTEVPAPKK